MSLVIKSHGAFRRTFGTSPVMKLVGTQNCISKYNFYKPTQGEFGSEQFWLERRIMKYRALNCRLMSPRPSSFQSHGQSFDLPYSAKDLPLVNTPGGIHQQKLHFLSGYFGEAGNIDILGPGRGSLVLSVFSSSRNPEILVHFLRAFGGSIRLHHSALSASRSNLQWYVCGDNARRMIDVLLSGGCRKGRQLRIVKEWPASSDMAARQNSYKLLTSFKKSSDQEFEFTNIEALCGFLDRKIHINVSALGRCMVRINNKDKIVLQQLMTYLDSIGLSTGHVRASGHDVDRNKFFWVECKKQNVFQLLRMIQPYMVQKRAEVDLVLANESKLSSIRQELHSLRGNARLFVRDDTHSCKLAIQIQSLRQYMARRIKAVGTASSYSINRLQDLENQRHLQRLCFQADRRRDFIRASLDEGACVVPVDQVQKRLQQLVCCVSMYRDHSNCVFHNHVSQPELRSFDGFTAMGVVKRVAWKTFKYGTGAVVGTVGGVSAWVYAKEPKKMKEEDYKNFTPHFNRNENLERLKNEDYDVLVIGGGATGTSVALDCATRGIKCALVERYDFASGTSSRSSKLLHGGVRYLEKAVYNLDPGQLQLVWEALRERGHMLHSTPFMTRGLPIVMPLYSYFDVLQMTAGVTLYEILGRMATLYDPGLPNCYLLTRSNAIFNFPLLKGDGMRAALLYYDGQQNDARVNMSIAMTAATPVYIEVFEHAALANHCKAIRINMDQDGKPCGALVRDELSGKEFEIKSKVVVNCDGPFSDQIRNLVDDGSKEKKREYIVPAMGAHVTLPRAYSAPPEPDDKTNTRKRESTKAIKWPRPRSHRRPHQLFSKLAPWLPRPKKVCSPLPRRVVLARATRLEFETPFCKICMRKRHVGFMIPKTSDGRVLFYLPWENNVVVGTTDCKQPLCDWPAATADEIDWIVKESANYLELSPHDIRKDIMSVWSGIRPLVRDPRADPSNTQALSRDHEVIIEDSGLVTICGGKWTTCRLMAEDGVNKMLKRHPAVKAHQPCRTYHLNLIDSHDLSGKFGIARAEHCLPDKVAMYVSRTYALELNDAYHLVQNYGFRCMQLIEDTQQRKNQSHLLSTFFTQQNFLRAEVTFACKHEMAHKLYDV
eukprot:gene452-132_t